MPPEQGSAFTYRAAAPAACRSRSPVASEGRSVVTLNIVDFAALDWRWKAANRSHAGVVYVASSTFPRNKGFIGSLGNALDRAIKAGRIPDRDSTSVSTSRP